MQHPSGTHLAKRRQTVGGLSTHQIADFLVEHTLTIEIGSYIDILRQLAVNWLKIMLLHIFFPHALSHPQAVIELCFPPLDQGPVIKFNNSTVRFPSSVTPLMRPSCEKLKCSSQSSCKGETKYLSSQESRFAPPQVLLLLQDAKILP